jgi:hypothetical protein
MREDIESLTAQRDLGRKQARQQGRCTRCIVRRARPGKAWCQNCAEYSARNKRERKAKANYGIEPFRNKIASSRDFRRPREADDRLIPPDRFEPSKPVRETPESPSPHRRYVEYVDGNPYRSIGASRGGMRSPELPMGWRDLFDEIDSD